MSKFYLTLPRSRPSPASAVPAARRAIGALGVASLWLVATPALATGPLDGTASLAADAASIAAEMQWNTNATIDLLGDQAAFNDLVGDLSVGYPSSFSAAENIPAPGGSGKIRFKGSIPQGAQTLITASGLSITTYTTASETETEIYAHADAVAEWLKNNNYTSFAVAFTVLGGVEVTIGANQSQPTLPQNIAYGVYFQLTSGPAHVYDWARGGADAIATLPHCTTGFSVVEIASGVNGSSSAGHCLNLSTLDNRNGDTSTMTGEDEHLGAFGDVEWHTTGDTDVNEIWWRDGTDDDDRRYIENVQTTITRGTLFCNFGMMTGDDCDTVWNTAVWGYANGRLIKRLVAMQHDEKVGGDSGGPWYTGSTAVGLHQGSRWYLGWQDLFSRASRLPDALGVEVLTE